MKSDLKINQNLSSWGGPREGSGRKQGTSEATLIKRKIREYFTEPQVKELIKEAKVMAKKNPHMLSFLLEQIFGRAPQRIEMLDKDEKPVILQISKALAVRYHISDPSTSPTE